MEYKFSRTNPGVLARPAVRLSDDTEFPTSGIEQGLPYNVSRLSTGTVVITVTTELQDDFKRLINRGLNVWDQAPPHIKSLGDLITEGKVLQDYSAQDFTIKRDDAALDHN